ncbi:hypothetical protein X275_01250 [Marinitoga sp. 1197]|uniref:hypothetical protein n=1 Tax=Marinitoga sp. 1197 TaxID=1428449 RepID=UPI000641293F|nr:hypothetical protein [Marinitoga sp. 1197]AJW76899.1 hypothetical protein UF08_10 [Marinitoga camini virus 1]KLO24047.1 hypothetical protein X275_01250 [Marinitoga sp. 1197]
MFFFRKKPKDILNITFDEDLVKILKEKFRIEDPLNYIYTCSICKQNIGFNKIGAIKIKNNKLYVICEECI